MSTVKHKVYDLDTAQSEFDTTMDILADNEALLDGIITDLEAYSSSAVTMLTTQISDFKNMHAQVNQDMTSVKNEIKEIETSATEKFKPINETNLLSLKTPEVLEALKGIGEVLNEDLSKESLAPSTGFIEWINARDNELNDGLIETALNPIDEHKQRKAEAVYHANQAVYESAYANFVDDITFKTEIDYIERVISEVDGFSKEDFPVIAEGNLYESLFDSAVGVSYSDFTKGVTDEYEVTYLEREGNRIAWGITVILLVTPIPGDGAAALSTLSAKYLPKFGVAGDFLLGASAKIKAAWSLGTLNNGLIGSGIKNTFIVLETHDLVLDALNGNPKEFFSDILVMPVNFINFFDNELFNFNDIDENTLESQIGKILDIAEAQNIELDKLQELHDEKWWI